LHNWVISLETGAAQGADHGKVASVPVTVDGDQLLIAVDALASLAA
jgi:nitrite reductase (NADH) small subunit